MLSGTMKSLAPTPRATRTVARDRRSTVSHRKRRKSDAPLRKPPEGPSHGTRQAWNGTYRHTRVKYMKNTAALLHLIRTGRASRRRLLRRPALKKSPQRLYRTLRCVRGAPENVRGERRGLSLRGPGATMLTFSPHPNAAQSAPKCRLVAKMPRTAKGREEYEKESFTMGE